MKFKCPLCNSELTEARYRNVIKVQQKEERLQKGELDKFKKQMVAAKDAVVAARKREKEIVAKSKLVARDAHKSGALAERQRSERLIKGQAAKMKKLQERLKMMESGTTPQAIGLADEAVLVSRLQNEFPLDRIEHAGKGGDVLHFVCVRRDEVGCILYECKHTDRIQSDHIQQASRDKKIRNASYGIVVTTGTRKGFSGLDQEDGVFIVAQAGVITLAHLCRDSLVAMAKERLNAEEREAAAKRVMDFITSPLFKTPIEDAISQTERAHRALEKEIRQHVGDWRNRHETYQTIRYDVSHIRNNIARVLDRQPVLRLEKPKFDALFSVPTLRE